MDHSTTAHKQTIIPLLVCIDFDRTLCDEAMVDSAMERACQATGLSVNVIRNTKQAIESHGDSFSTLEYLQQHYSEAVVQQVKKHFITIAWADDLLYEDSLPLLQALRQHAIPHVILTQGSAEWQELKVNASKLSGTAFKIIAEKDKGKEIIGWRLANGLYRLPVDGFAPVQSVALIDDKAKSFTSLPANCSGFLLRRSNEQVLPSQHGKIPGSVTVISSLSEVIISRNE